VLDQTALLLSKDQIPADLMEFFEPAECGRCYICTMVHVFREIRRVLRDDGTCWVNMGDSYCSGTAAERKPTTTKGSDVPASWSNRSQPERIAASAGVKPKDLLMMPARLALALQADGWWLRSDIIWHKPNPMPESCRDRPTSAHEHIFLLAKKPRYYYDADAVREPQDTANPDHPGYRPIVQAGAAGSPNGAKYAAAADGINSGNAVKRLNACGRNLRNVWTIATHAYPQAHFATFPPELAERCIKAGTSERGCCAQCGAPWVRVTETTYTPGGPKHSGNAKALRYIRDGEREDSGYKTRHDTTTGWQPSCRCGTTTEHFGPFVPSEPVPCTVLDPFIGAGTTALVSDRLGRDCIGIDLNVAYTEMAMERVRADAPLFVDIDAGPMPEHPVETQIADLFAEAAE